MADSSDPLNWTVLLPVIAGGLAVWYLLPSPQKRPLVFGALAGVVALAGVAAFLVRGLGQFVPETVEAGLFFGFAGLAVLFAGLMITNGNPARSALCFAMVVLSTCGLFLLNAAPFLSAATIIIYAGAIIVTFLFVIMLAHQEGPSNANLRSREPALAVAAGFVLLATLLVGLQKVYDHRSVGAVIEQADRIARDETVDPAFLSPKTGEATPPLTPKAAAFIADVRAAVDRVRVAVPRAGTAGPEYTDHPAVQGVDTAIFGLENYSFRHGDTEEVRTNCQRIADGLSALQKYRTGGAAFDDVQVSEYGVVKPVDDSGARKLPAANVAAVGRTLFTDHLLAVELAGTLLLVATVGAILIAGGRRGKSA